MADITTPFSIGELELPSASIKHLENLVERAKTLDGKAVAELFLYFDSLGNQIQLWHKVEILRSAFRVSNSNVLQERAEVLIDVASDSIVSLINQVTSRLAENHTDTWQGYVSGFKLNSESMISIGQGLDQFFNILKQFQKENASVMQTLAAINYWSDLNGPIDILDTAPKGGRKLWVYMTWLLLSSKRLIPLLKADEDRIEP